MSKNVTCGTVLIAQNGTITLSIGAPEVVGMASNTHELPRNFKPCHLLDQGLIVGGECPNRISVALCVCCLAVRL